MIFDNFLSFRKTFYDNKSLKQMLKIAKKKCAKTLKCIYKKERGKSAL